MIKSKIVLLSALVSCALISGCKEENKTNVSIEFMHSSVEQERQAVISKLIARCENKKTQAFWICLRQKEKCKKKGST